MTSTLELQPLIQKIFDGMDFIKQSKSEGSCISAAEVRLAKQECLLYATTIAEQAFGISIPNALRAQLWSNSDYKNGAIRMGLPSKKYRAARYEIQVSPERVTLARLDTRLHALTAQIIYGEVRYHTLVTKEQKVVSYGKDRTVSNLVGFNSFGQISSYQKPISQPLGTTINMSSLANKLWYEPFALAA